MKLSKIFMALAAAIAATLFSLVAYASPEASATVNDAPAWVYVALGAIGVIAGFITHVDAQISEDFKRKWPWWIRMPWDYLAGNYKHSCNAKK
ncbi:hypothetical protein [Vibrio cincinnatiensis]|uniref:hypothetical protein n=1 Tax=Vibrio cincinnatiensis TaxID=675 RepID=UPI001FA97A52|nr:hypothetical protein [Vibrio cincinnatiensis]